MKQPSALKAKREFEKHKAKGGKMPPTGLGGFLRTKGYVILAKRVLRGWNGSCREYILHDGSKLYALGRANLHLELFNPYNPAE